MTNFNAGNIKTLRVKKQVTDGYLIGDNTADVVLKTEEKRSIGDQVDVFLYHDKNNELKATLELPSVRFNAFDWAEVLRVIDHLGVFVKIGEEIDVLLSSDDLPEHRHVWPVEGDQVYVSLKLDKKDRLLADPVKEEDFEGTWPVAPESLDNKDISGRVFRSGREGAVMISEDGYRGFIHHSEQIKEPRVGEWVEGRVIKVKDDGTLNVSLFPRKQDAQAIDAEMLLDYLKEHDGEMSFDNKSDPDKIQKTFKISKSAFKRAIGKLYKDRLIVQENGKTLLTERIDSDR